MPRMSQSSTRKDGRKPDETREIVIEPGFMPNAEGSALVKLGDTHVICTASVSPRCAEVDAWSTAPVG